MSVQSYASKASKNLPASSDSSKRVEIVSEEVYEAHETPVQVEQVDVSNEEQLGFYEKYKDESLLTAPALLLFKVLLKKLASLSHKDLVKFGTIVDWSNDLLKKASIQDLRTEIFNMFENAYIDSNGRTALCNVRYSKFHEAKRANWMFYSNDKVVNLFMTSRFYVPNEILDEHDAYLIDAKVSEILDQLAYRIGRIHEHLYAKNRPHAACQEDFDIELQINQMYNLLISLRDEAVVHEKEQARLYEKNKEEYQKYLERAKNVAPLQKKTFVETGQKKVVKKPFIEKPTKKN